MSKGVAVMEGWWGEGEVEGKKPRTVDVKMSGDKDAGKSGSYTRMVGEGVGVKGDCV